MYKSHVAFEFASLSSAFFMFTIIAEPLRDSGIFWGISAIVFFMLRRVFWTFLKCAIRKGTVTITPTHLTYSRWTTQQISIKNINRIDVIRSEAVDPKSTVDGFTMAINNDDLVFSFSSPGEEPLYLSGCLFKTQVLFEIIEKILSLNPNIVLDPEVRYYFREVKKDSSIVIGWMIGGGMLLAGIFTILYNHTNIFFLFKHFI